MHPEFLTIGGRTFYWYGVMMALAFLSGILTWRHLARFTGRPPDFGSDLAIWVLLPGIAGARLFYVLSNLPFYLADPAEIWRIDHGGLIFYGGILGGVAGALFFARRRHVAMKELLDFLVTAVPLGHAFGRIGCFLNGCCYGTPTVFAWGVVMAGDIAARHPVQLLEAGGNLLLFGALYVFYRRRPRPGIVTAAYLAIYPALRFGLEFLRGDDRWRFLNLTAAQWLSLALIATGIFLAHHAYRRTDIRLSGKRSAPPA